MKNKRNQLQARRLGLKRWDYWLVVGVSLLIILVMFIFNTYSANAKQAQVNLVKDFMAETSESKKDQFEQYVEERIRTLQILVTYSDIYEMDEDAQKEFLFGRSAKLGFSHLFIVNMQGTGYYIDENVHRNQSGEDFFYNIRNNDIYITEPFYTGEGAAIMTACVSIYDKQGKKVGILCGAINLDSIQQLISSNETILDGNSYILDKNGRYVTSQNASDVYNKIPIYQTPNSELSLIEEAFAEKTDKEGTIILDGIEYQTYITYVHDYNWVIVQNIPVSQITERYAFLNWVQYILISVIVVLVCCVTRIIYCWNKSNKKIYTDTLTKCNSRAACLDILDYLEDNKKQQVTIVYMDLNRFKWVNDTYGHEKGDELLKVFADVLMQTLGKEGFVGRMGGDEFIAVLLDVSEQRLMGLWHQVESELSIQSESLGLPCKITSSFGYAMREAGDVTPMSSVLQMADERMYENKTAQKSKITE